MQPQARPAAGAIDTTTGPPCGRRKQEYDFRCSVSLQSSRVPVAPKNQDVSILGASATPKIQEFLILAAATPKIQEFLILAFHSTRK